MCASLSFSMILLAAVADIQPSRRITALETIRIKSKGAEGRTLTPVNESKSLISPESSILSIYLK